MAKTNEAGSTETHSGRWSLLKKGTKVVLRYSPPKSEEEISFELTKEQLTETRRFAKKGDAARVRDTVLDADARAAAMSSSGISSVVAANTWRWALPLFGGPKPAEHASRKPGPRFGRRSTIR